MNNLLIILAALVILFASCSLYLGFSNYRKSDQLYKETQEKFIRYQDTNPVSDGETPEEKDSTIAQNFSTEGKKMFPGISGSTKNASESGDDPKSEITDEADGTAVLLQSDASETGSQTNSIQVDFSGLKAINPDIIGWSYVENTGISYPLLYSGDDEAYLRRGYDGSALNAGSIFLRGANNPDLSDSLSVIYGHNTQNGSMFGGLTAYADEGYRNAHSCFRIILPGACYCYQIDQCGVVSSTDSLYATTNDGSSSRRVVLSTCYGEEKRFIVSGILTEILSN